MENLDPAAETADNGKITLEPKEKKAKKNQVKDTKVRVLLNCPEDSPLAEFINSTKNRGIKNFDLGDFILGALGEFSDEWWQDKLERHTPLEYKINAALSDPNMREKLTELLASEKMDRGDEGALHS